MMRWLSVVTLLGLLSLGAQSTRSVVLEWETNAPEVDVFVLEQCVEQRGGCAMHAVATFDGLTGETTVRGLQPRKRYCWRVQPQAPGMSYPYSNTECRPS